MRADYLYDKVELIVKNKTRNAGMVTLLCKIDSIIRWK
jgi:hypothetical protein